MINIDIHKVFGDRFSADELNQIVDTINVLINGSDPNNRNFTSDDKLKLDQCLLITIENGDFFIEYPPV